MMLTVALSDRDGLKLKVQEMVRVRTHHPVGFLSSFAMTMTMTISFARLIYNATTTITESPWPTVTLPPLLGIMPTISIISITAVRRGGVAIEP